MSENAFVEDLKRIESQVSTVLGVAIATTAEGAAKELTKLLAEVSAKYSPAEKPPPAKPKVNTNATGKVVLSPKEQEQAEWDAAVAAAENEGSPPAS